MSNFIIRTYEDKDREQIEHISYQVQEWEKQYYPGRALSKEVISRHVRRLITSIRNSKGVILVAVIKDKCVGYIVGTVHKDFLNTEETFYVKDMGIDKEYRRLGIGTTLLKHVEQIAKEKFGLKKLMIGVICGNDGAEKLYRRLGFTPYGLELLKAI